MDVARRGIAAAAVALGLVAIGVMPSAWADETDPPAAEDAGSVRVEAAAADAVSDESVRAVAAMSLRERAASVVMGHIPTTDTAALRDYMASTGIGGFILMGANIPASESALRDVTAALTIDPALPPLLAIDQEGGDVSRLPWDGFPSSLELKDAPPAAAQDAFAARAALVQRAGIGVNFGIVADETNDPGSFIYRRALGTTPDSAAERVAAAVAGEGSAAMSTLKHFPGHGAAPGDSHRGIPSTDMSKDQWAASDGVPFAAGIDADAPLLMFGHLAYTAVDAAPASLSAEWHRIAREELGFEGIAVTDDLGMLEASGDPRYGDPVANAVAALAAGNDVVLGVMFSDSRSATRIVDGIVSAVESGSLPAERLDEAAARVHEMRTSLAADGRGLMPCADCESAG
ncbi:glycoside hydrolase family 3 N-terminal domain-containing protein [Microbacterium sp. SSM24]|uniref:glycoside hydrolase family 3 N-terminal domain-containing protein n=1 Tax=Microbacterium sp. SSM24 TaxID=2991714 RepID=UPI0022280BD5|nr:glycoside hydrolase family 3 N-terminal domain-containing protein [Microbacterium sp. SSM24]MCW3494656.1 glycoside hydrolase family 3 protein [Microbacterium sp. SSM24]